jgi:ankyrin repeat protein
VPWKVLTPASLEALKQEAFDPARYNRQAKQLLFEYAVLYNVPALIDQLVAFKFNRARNAAQELPAVERKYHQDYTERSFHALSRKLGLYGVDFRNPLNQTPLMIAARMGLSPLIQALIRDGANPHLVDNWGRNPLQIALRQAYLDERYARICIGQAYPALAPSSIKIRIDDRLTKLDNHRPEFFLLNSMLAVAQDILRVKIRYTIPAFQTGDFVEALADFPDHVIPPWRKHRQYITAVLARHEIFREDPYNRKLFLRVHRGYYILNPRMEVEVNDAWVNVYDLLQIEHLEKEKDNPRLQQFVDYVRRWQKVLMAAPAPVSPEPGAALPASGSQPPLPQVVEPRPEGEPGGDFPVDEGLAAPGPASAPPIEASDKAGQLPLFPDEDPLF